MIKAETPHLTSVLDIGSSQSWSQPAACLQEELPSDLSLTLSLLKQQERLDIEEKYTSLQEEAQGKTKKLKKVWTMLMAAKSEVSRT